MTEDISNLRSVSWSELSTFQQCPKRWSFVYDRKIEPKATSEAPTTGSACHAGIAAVNNGFPAEEGIRYWQKEFMRRNAPIFEEEQQALNETVTNAIAVVNRFVEKYDDSVYTVVAVEKPFKVQIPGTDVVFDGVWDAIVRDTQGNHWLREYKFIQTNWRTEEDLELNGQTALYQYAALLSGIKIAGTIFDQARAMVPKVPALNANKKGEPGKWVSRVKITTDWETYAGFVKRHNDDPSLYEEDMKPKLSEIKWFQRDLLYRTPEEVLLYAEDLVRRFVAVSNPDKMIYMNDVSSYGCRMCPYRILCTEGIRGRDIEGIIEDQFKKREKTNHVYDPLVPYREPEDGGNGS